ncbi:MAG: mucin-binding protein, partial [Leuconostoc carnosum]|uniref:mucin-binding protein n=1 Tax=Leuconostoc carnosum TaxID=1252 RepID=UPI003F9829A4
MEERKSRFKMYKSGKLWVVAGMTAVLFGLTSVNIDHASASTTDSNSSQNSQLEKPISETDKSVTAPATAKSDSSVKTPDTAQAPSTPATDKSVTAPATAKSDSSVKTPDTAQAPSTPATDKSVTAPVTAKSDSSEKIPETAQAPSTPATDKSVTTPATAKTDSSAKTPDATQTPSTPATDKNVTTPATAKTDSSAKTSAPSAHVDDKITKAAKTRALIAKAKVTPTKNEDGKNQYSSLPYSQALELDEKVNDNSKPESNIALTDTFNQNNLPKQYKGDGMTGDTLWQYSGNSLFSKDVYIQKNWANAGIINGKKVNFHEKFHNFTKQKNPNNWGIKDIPTVDAKNPYVILISSNAIDNIDVYNMNFQETFWFTYEDGTIVPISSLNQDNADTNNNSVFYFMSASLSSNKENLNRSEYAQTNDAKSVIISKDNINDTQTGFTAGPSTIGLQKLTDANIKSAYTNTDPDNYKSADGEDSNPDYYALQGGVTFADFTSDTPTLFLGAVPINPSNTSWWHGNHNKNSDMVSFISYNITETSSVNETINYVDQKGNTLANQSKTGPINFITVKAWNGTTATYYSTTETTAKLDNNGVPIGKSWTKNSDETDPDFESSATFKAIANPDVPKYKVISTDDPANDLTQTTAKHVYATSNDLNYTVVYAPAYNVSDTKTVTQTVHYVDQNGKTVTPNKTADPITFVTVTNPVDGSTSTYYSTTATKPTLDNNGVPTGDWTKGDSTEIPAITNPDVPNYSVISTDDPANDLTQTTAKTVDPNSGNTEYTVVYAPTYTVSDTKTVNETVHYVDQNGKTVANDAKATPVNFVIVTNPVDGSTTTYYSTTATKPTLDNNGVPTGDWTKGDSSTFAAITNPEVANHTVISTDDPANDLTQTTAKTVDATSGDLDYTVVYAVNKESANVTYIDDTTGKTLEAKDLSGDYNSTDSYRTTDTISNYESKGYKLVSDDYPTNGVVYDQDGVEQHFEVHLTHSTVPVTPDTPQVPGDPI